MDSAQTNPRSKRRRPRALVGSSVALATILLVFLGSELVLRMRGYDPLASLSKGRGEVLRPSAYPGLVYEPTPGASATFRGADVSINADGFRDRAYAREKAKGTRRIAVLGDSVAFGDGLPVEATFANQLEELYRIDGDAVEVLNFGVGGYDVLEAVLFFEQVGLAFRPDAVVFGFCINDAGVQSFNLPYIQTLKSYGPLTRNLRTLQYFFVSRDAARAGREYSTYNKEDVFRARNEGWIATLPADDPVRERMARIAEFDAAATVNLFFARWYTSEDRIGKIRFAFERLAAHAREQGFTVYLVPIPYLAERGHGEAYAAIYELVAAEGERAGFRTVDVLASFRAAGLPKLATYPDGHVDPLHPNTVGHGLLAERIRAALD